jgi:hypothetical protein
MMNHFITIFEGRVTIQQSDYSFANSPLVFPKTMSVDVSHGTLVFLPDRSLSGIRQNVYSNLHDRWGVGTSADVNIASNLFAKMVDPTGVELVYADIDGSGIQSPHFEDIAPTDGDTMQKRMVTAGYTLKVSEPRANGTFGISG